MKQKLQIVLSLLLVIIASFFFQLGRSDLLYSSLNSSDIRPAKISSDPEIIKLPLSSGTKNTQESPYKKNKALIIAENLNDANYDKTVANVLLTLERLEFITNIVSIDVIPGLTDSMSDYDMILVLPSIISAAGNSSEISSYVSQGGRLLILFDPSQVTTKASEELLPMAGVSASYNIKQTASFELTSELITSLTGKLDLTGETLAPHDYIQYQEFELEPNCEIHVVSAEGDPLIWQYKLLNGSVLVMNTSHYSSRYMRGLIFGSISKLMDITVYPTAAAVTIFIDDFPANYNAEIPLIRNEYGRDYERFITDIWWPKMEAVAKSHNLKLNASLIISFDNDTDNIPAKVELNDSTKLLIQELLMSGGELCLHGYNHQPLTCDQAASASYGYSAWPNEAAAAASLQIVDNALQALLPGYHPQVYIPPSDLFADSERLIDELIYTLPYLEVVSGIYYEPPGKEGKSEDFLVQDNGMTNSSNNEFINLPRISSGPFLSDEGRFLTASAAMTEGLISHTVFVDDVLDPIRSRGKTCEQLIQAYDNIFTWFDESFADYEKLTASEAARSTAATFEADISFDLTEDQLTLACDNFIREQTVVVCLDAELKSVTNCEVSRLDTMRWIVRLNGPLAVLEVSGNENLSDS